MHDDTHESSNHFAKWKKAYTEYVMHESICMKFYKKTSAEADGGGAW